jgi:hypothetical protein
MKKEYNEWYWKIYRWFRWEAKHFHRDVAQGFRNLWKWFSVIWKDRDWDDFYIFEVLKHKIKNTADYTEKKQRFVGWEKEVRYMRICVKLIERLQDEYYQAEYFDYHDVNHTFVPVKGSEKSFEIKSETTRDDLETYISMYPHAYRRLMNDEKLMNYKKGNHSIALGMGIIRHRKAKKLLFKILENRIEHWWD